MKKFLLGMMIFTLNIGQSYASAGDDEGPSNRKADFAAAFNEIKRKAIEEDSPLAYQLLAKIYQTGKYVKQDYSLALKYAKKSAELGSALGEYTYAYMLMHGQGVERNYKDAYTAFIKASEMGENKANFYIGWILEYGLGVKKDPKKAFGWYKKGAEGGDPRSQNRVGEIYEIGDIVKRDNSLAVKWFAKGAEHGFELAKFNLAKMYVLDARPVVQRNGVLMLANLAQKNSNLYGAQYYYLGIAYRNARGVAKSNNQALLWFKKAVEADGLGVYKKHASEEINAIQEEEVKCSNVAVVTLFGQPLICALRDSFRKDIKNAGAEVVREDERYFADVYKADKVLSGSSDFSVYYYKGQFATARYTFPRKAESDQILSVEKIVENKYGHFSRKQSVESKGLVNYLWGFGDGMVIRLYQVNSKSPIFLQYINPRIDDQLKARLKAIEEQKKAKQQAASSAV